MNACLAGPKNDEYLIEQLIQQAQAGHESAACQIREFLARGVRWYLRRNAPEASTELDTRRVLDSVIDAVKDSQITNLVELASFTRKSARLFIIKDVAARRKTTLLDARDVQRMKQALTELHPDDREALIRYFEGQSPKRVCADLGMSESTLTVLRSQLRMRYAELRSCN